jgi:signal peptidase I
MAMGAPPGIEAAERPRQAGQGPSEAAKRPRPGAAAEMRAWADALIVAFVLALFLRVFVIELFKIPSGSMTPTLIGGQVAQMDYNGDGRPDLLLMDASDRPLLFLDDGERLRPQGPVSLSREERRRLESEGRVHSRNDRILVNKLAYWFHPPARGDIVVFEAPPAIWEPGKAVFVKRCVGLPGETLGFDADGGLTVNGVAATDPPVFARQRYRSLLDPSAIAAPGGVIEADPGTDWEGRRRIRRMHVPYGQILVLGDNADSSLDSRYWGGVPIENVKGRAFFRYYPPSQMKFLSGQ